VLVGSRYIGVRVTLTRHSDDDKCVRRCMVRALSACTSRCLSCPSAMLHQRPTAGSVGYGGTRDVERRRGWVAVETASSGGGVNVAM